MNNHRAFPRFPIDLAVSVTLEGVSTESCRVRDYCAGGMYLLCGDTPPAVAADDHITIRFANPQDQAQSYELEARVVRPEEHGLGVAFTTPNQVAMMALAQLAERQSAQLAPAAVSVSGDVAAMVRDCRERGLESIERMVAAFFAIASERLFHAAEQSTSNIQQSAFFGAINELTKGKEGLSERIVAELEQRFAVLDQPGYRPPAIAPESKVREEDSLSLVDHKEFDNWLVVRSIAAKVEGFMHDQLEALETRLAAIAVNRLDKESNPLGPLALASVMSQAIDTLTLEEVAKKALFLVIEEILDKELRFLYDDLNTMLMKHGVLPELKKKLEVVKVPGTPHAARRGEAEQMEVVEQPASVDEAPPPMEPAPAIPAAAPAAEPQPAVASQQGELVQPDAAVTTGEAVAATAAPQGGGEALASGPQAPQLSYSRVASASAGQAASGPALSFTQMQELMHLHGSGVAEAAPAPSGYFSSGEVMQALAHLEGAVVAAERAELDAVGHAQYLAQILSSLSGEAGKGLSAADRDTITYVGGLFSAMHHDHHLPQVVRPWLARMEVPLLKAGVIDPSMVEDADHPARQVVNRLEQVGRHVATDQSETRVEVHQQIDQLLDAIQQRVDEDPEVFAEVVARLDEIRDGYGARYRESVEQIVEACEQESDLDAIREEILHTLNELLSKREVPTVILTLLDSGFKNLLFRTHVKSGPQSELYRSYLGFIDLLTARLARREPVKAKRLASDESLLQWLPRMLESSSRDEARNEALRKELEGYLRGEAQPAMQYVPALTVKSHHLDAARSKPEGLDVDSWQMVLDDACAIEPGETFVYHDEEGGEPELTLVWRARPERKPRFAFADSSGAKRLELSLGELARLLHGQRLARLELGGVSVTERATYDFLKSIQDNLSRQAQHDELTGLLNRKSFERELERAYTEAIASQRSGVLAYFDLDRFNVINTTCGHAEGDKLLQQIAGIFKVNLGEGATVARLGGDEFGVILKGASRVDGLKRITALHDEIRAVRFSCADSEFNVTASVGIAEINDSSDSSGRLLSAVDAACFTAKEQGRDNIQIYNAENVRISNRSNILDWVGRINVLFDKNLIKLRCQKIDPVKKTINSLPHYEVLLDVQDEEGNRVPLEEFIVAAERYNRIVDIDTWVVDYVLNWLQEHQSKLTRINGLSINLSGSSIGNPRFMEHLQQRLSEEGFPSNKVIFEVTETIAINNLDNAARFMRKLKETGVQFSLDDFGSGTSSYSYLKSLPIDYLKIDGAFVKDVARNTNDYAVVKSINEIGHVMGKKTVAEYVVDEFAFEALKAIGLDYVQGFGVEKPIPLYKLFG